MKATFASATLAWMFLQSTTPGLADSNVPPVALAVSSNLSVVAGTPLTPEEAEQALKRLSRKVPGAGTWRRTRLEFEPDSLSTNAMPGWLQSSNVTYGWPTSTNTVYEQLSPNGRVVVRKEISRLDSNGGVETKIYLRNGDGYWAVLKSAAVLFPESEASRSANRDSSTPPTESSVELGVVRASYNVTTGERIEEGDRVLLRITQSFTDAGYREVVKEAKKQLPFFLRPFFSTSFIERGFGQVIPCRVETILDEATGNLIVRRQYRKDGKPLEVEEGWSPVPDLAAEAYAVPEGLKQNRPKSIDAAWKLQRKIRAEEAKAAKKNSTRKDPNDGTNSAPK